MIKKITLHHKKTESKKIFVYDNQKFYGNYLKYNFGKQYDLILSKGRSEEFNIHVRQDSCSFVFFVVYSDADLYDFLNLYTRGVPLIAASNNREILKKMNEVPNIITVDLGLSRTKMTNEIASLFLLCTL